MKMEDSGWKFPVFLSEWYLKVSGSLFEVKMFWQEPPTPVFLPSQNGKG
jgi:hypothetical protein